MNISFAIFCFIFGPLMLVSSIFWMFSKKYREKWRKEINRGEKAELHRSIEFGPVIFIFGAFLLFMGYLAITGK